MDYPKSIPGVGLVNGGFVDENPVTGTPGSLIPAQWGNSLTEEVLNAIKAAGLTPDEARTDQLATAIGALVDFKKLRNTPTTLSGYGISDATGRLLAVKQFDTVGITVYVPDPRAKRIRVRLVGAGGSGGGCGPAAANAQNLGGGGGAGAYGEGLYDIKPEMLSGIPVSLGAGGVPSATTGKMGSGASFGSLLSVSGGGGGQVMAFTTPAATSANIQGGVGGQVVTGGNLCSARGTPGTHGMFNSIWGTLSGAGGPSPFDGGAPWVGLNTTAAPGLRGSGGAGSCSSNTSATFLSGAGGNAFCEIWEYA